MLALFCSLLAFCALGLAAFGIGRPLLRKLGVGQQDSASIAAWTLSLGLTALGWAGAWLAMAPSAFMPAVCLLTVAAALVGIAELVCAGVAGRADYLPQLSRGILPSRGEALPWLRPVLAFAAAAIIGIALARIFFGPPSPRALTQDLLFAKQLGATRLLDLEPAWAPTLPEVWYAWAVALEGPASAALVNWLCGILLAVATTLLGRLVLGRGPAPLAGMAVMLAPCLFPLMSAPLAEIGAPLFGTLMLAALWRAATHLENWQWAALAGVMLASTLGSGAAAWPFVAAAAAMCGWFFARRRLGQKVFLRQLSITLLAACCAYVPWAPHAGRLVIEWPAAIDWQLTLRQLGPLCLALLPFAVLGERTSQFKLATLMLAVQLATCLLISRGQSSLLSLAPLAAIMTVAGALQLSRLPKLPAYACSVATATLIAAAVCERIFEPEAATDFQSEAIAGQRRIAANAGDMLRSVGRPTSCLLSDLPNSYDFPCPTVAVHDLAKANLRLQTRQAVIDWLVAAGFDYVLLAPVDRGGSFDLLAPLRAGGPTAAYEVVKPFGESSMVAQSYTLRTYPLGSTNGSPLADEQRTAYRLIKLY